MVSWHWVRLLFCLRFTFTPCRSLNGEGICIDSNGKHCCTGYIQMGDTCEQCEPGYFSINCSLTCPENYHGRQCRERCDCDSDKYCDSIVGCLCKNNSVNCTDQHQDPEETSVGVTISVQSNSQNSSPRRAVISSVPLLFPLLGAPVVACIAVLAVGGRIWYSKTTKRKDFAVRDEEDGVQNDASRELYNHLNLRVRLSNTSFFHTRRSHGADREPPLVLSQESLSQLTGDMTRYTITDGQGGTTIVPQPCGEDVANEPFYPNAILSLQQTVFNTDIPPHTTWRDTDVSYFNLGHLSCPSGGPSGGDIRPDSTVSSEASDDLYFDVSYAGQLAVSVDKFDVSSSPTNKQESCQTDAVLLTKHFARRKSETEMSSFLRRSTESVCSEKKGEHFSLTDTRPDSLTASEASDELYFDVSYAGQLALSVDKLETEMTLFFRRSTESVCSEKKSEHFSLIDTRPDSLTASEASDELYFDVSYVGQATNSCVQGGTDSLSSSCSSQFRNESSDYINCSDLF
uniref:Uncharacterized protein LOC111137039 n=1 Tax=Crassostrea virginica TaxID=6565 RepID=A0A8B8EVF7_CRAVI|nr:uncharacterized protein LOC111137039 [Crassostrea virginica]